MRIVLIVDDNERNRRLARDVLIAAGFQTLEAATAGEGITLATEHLPDVILMDLQLPDMNGADAAHTLAGSERTAAIPVIVMSASSIEGGGDWLAEAGFAGTIEKPILLSTFADQVRGYCRPEA